MKTTRTLNSGALIEIIAENPANTLRRIGTIQTERIAATVIPAADLPLWEEAPLPDPAEAEAAAATADYEAEVERRIRQRYTLSQELALLRQRDTKPDEFAAYNAWAEQCKAAARAEANPE